MSNFKTFIFRHCLALFLKAGKSKDDMSLYTFSSKDMFAISLCCHYNCGIVMLLRSIIFCNNIIMEYVSLI